MLNTCYCTTTPAPTKGQNHFTTPSLLVIFHLLFGFFLDNIQQLRPRVEEIIAPVLATLVVRVEVISGEGVAALVISRLVQAQYMPHKDGLAG
jgi:hypothetical protein